MNSMNDDKRHQPIVSVMDSSTPTPQPIIITRDGSLARIVVYEKENLTCEEINALLNVASCKKIDLDKHFERIGCEDKHIYTVYNVLI